MLPKLAEGDANKVFVIPSEFAQAFAGIGEALARASRPWRRRRQRAGRPPERPARHVRRAARSGSRLRCRCSTRSRRSCRRRSPMSAGAGR